MNTIGKTEVVQDDGKMIFMGPPGCGKTRSMLLEASLLEFDTVWALDPFGDIKTALEVNLDQFSSSFLQKIFLMKQVTDLPKDMDGKLLLIDDGRGWFSLVESGDHLDSWPEVILSTVQISRPISGL